MSKITNRNRKRAKIRAKINGTQERPRLSVFKSGRFIYAQLIDDEKANTLVASSSLKMKGKGLENAKNVGLDLAKKAKDKKITKVIFDRGGYLYIGQVKTLADGAREGGLEF